MSSSESGVPTHVSIQDLTDNDLITKIKTGDQKAYKVLVERYLTKLWRLAVSLLHDEQEAEDAVQEVFLSLWNSIGKWDEKGTAQFSTWVYRVTFNKCVDLKRKKKPTVSSENVPETSIDPDAYSNVLQAELSDKMIELLGGLPSRQKNVMLMYYYEELNVGEISNKLDVTEQSVRSLLKRGRRALKDTIQYDAAFKSWDFQGTTRHLWE